MKGCLTLMISNAEHHAFLASSEDQNPTHRVVGEVALVQGVHTVLRVADLLVGQGFDVRNFISIRAQFLLPVYTGTDYSIEFYNGSLVVGSRRSRNVQIDFVDQSQDATGFGSPGLGGWGDWVTEVFPKKNLKHIATQFRHLSVSQIGRQLIELFCIATRRAGSSLPAGPFSAIYSFAVTNRRIASRQKAVKFRERGSAVELLTSVGRLQASFFSSRGDLRAASDSSLPVDGINNDDQTGFASEAGTPQVVVIGASGQVGRRVSARLESGSVHHVAMRRRGQNSDSGDGVVINRQYNRREMDSVKRTLCSYPTLNAIVYCISPRITPARDFGLDTVKLRSYLDFYLFEVIDLFRLAELFDVSRLIIPGSTFQDDAKYELPTSPYFTYVQAKSLSEKYLKRMATGSQVEVFFPRLPPISNRSFEAAFDKLMDCINID